MQARLKVVKGPIAGETIQMPRGKLVIGRATDCQLRLDSPSVSQHHCVLLLDEYTMRIRDLGSSNGTMVNGRRIGKHESILLHDDTVSIDQLTFQIDLSQTAVGVPILDAEATSVSFGSSSDDAADNGLVTELDEADWNALDGTEILEGDTDHDVVPLQEVPSATLQPTISDELASPVEDEHTDPRSNRGPADAADSQPLPVTSTVPSVVEPPAASCGTPTTAVPDQALAPQSIISGAPPNRAPAQLQTPPVKRTRDSKELRGQKGKAASQKKAGATGVRLLPVSAALIALVGLGVGAYFLFGGSQPTQYGAPEKYVDFSPEIYGTLLGCEVPENWKQKFKGGKKVGPIWARFSDGPLSIEISENLTGSGIREAAIAMRRKPGRVASDASVAEQIHEYQRERTAETFKSYSEEPRSRGLKTQGLGEARLSNFTAKEGILSADVTGCRATALNQGYQFTVICKCPPALLHDATPVFEKVISSLRSGAVADAK